MALKDRLGLHIDPLFLIDGSALVYRAFNVFPDLKRSDGFPTNALFIVLRVLLKFLREEMPHFAAFFLDGKSPTFRHELYPAYKAQRAAMPEALLAQLPSIRDAVTLLGLYTEDSQNVEADDRIASLAVRFRDELPVVIVGGDKDFKQCLHKQVVLWDLSKKSAKGGNCDKLLTLEAFQAETGLDPVQWPDYQAIIGDACDNIPGVPGVGPKTALKLMARFPDLEALATALTVQPDSLTPVERRKLNGQSEVMFRWRELTRLRTDQAGEDILEHFRIRPLELPALRVFLETNEFHSFLRELSNVPAVPAGTSVSASQRNSETQHSLFNLA
ncbi:hypothetical protein DSUL_100221 [Desulfovibrionales bacterium]